MKLEPISKLDKKNKITSKKNDDDDDDDDVMLAKCDVIGLFSDLWSIGSTPEAGFRMHSLQN